MGMVRDRMGRRLSDGELKITLEPEDSCLSIMQGAPIAGYLLDEYGGTDTGLQAYRPAMFYAGSLSLAAAGAVAMMRLRISTTPAPEALDAQARNSH